MSEARPGRIARARRRVRQAKVVLAAVAIAAFLLAVVAARGDSSTASAPTQLQAPRDLVQQLGDGGLSGGQVAPSSGAPQVQSRSS